jgi:hypothetical protein
MSAWEGIADDDLSSAQAAAADAVLNTVIESGAGVGSMTGLDDDERVVFAVTVAKIEEGLFAVWCLANGEITVAVHR